MSGPSRRIHHRAASCRACVVIEKPAEALTTANPTAPSDGRRAVNEFVAEPLVIPLLVVVGNELGDRPAEMPVAEWNHPVEALMLDRAHEPFGIGIRIRGLERRLHHADPSLTQARAHGYAPFRVPDTDQHAMTAQDPLVRRGERATDLAHEDLIGMGR